MTKLFLSDTLVSGIRYALSDTQGTGATLGSGNEGGSTFVEKLRFEREVGLNGITGTSFPCSIDMASVSHSTLEWRFRVVKVDTLGNILAGSAYSTVFNTSGIQVATLILDTSWLVGDRVGISLELRKTGGGGNRSLTLNVNDLDSYVDAPLPAPTVEGSITQTLAALTTAGSGALQAAGSAAQTLGIIEQSASGSIADPSVSGVLEQTLASITQASTGAVEVIATSQQSLLGLTTQAVGELAFEGAASQTLPSLTQDGIAEASLDGTLSQVLPGTTQSAAGASGDVLSGAITSVLPTLSQAATGLLVFGGDGANVLGVLEQSLQGVIGLSVDSAQTLQALRAHLVGFIGEGVTVRVAVQISTNAVVGPSGQNRVV